MIKRSNGEKGQDFSYIGDIAKHPSTDSTALIT